MRIDYVALAYGVSGLVLAWDVFMPRVRLAAVRKLIRQRAQRESKRQGKR